MSKSIQRNLVSFPRSGQHMIERMLRDFHLNCNIPYSYCEYYNCCNTVPCKYNYIYQKNHDFNLNLIINSEQKYIFLYRKDKIEQLEAGYRYVEGTNEGKYDHISKYKPDYSNQNEYKNLVEFCKEKSYYYDNLVKKYVDDEQKNILPIDYNYFLENPVKIFHKILLFFGFRFTKDQVNFFIKNRKEKISKINKINSYLYEKLKNDLQFYK